MIKAEKLSYGFADVELYKKISFTLEDGCHCALIGSNGTGKTTLAELIHQPERFLFDGKLHRENVGRVGYVSQFASRDKTQEVSLFDYLSEDFLQLQQQIGEVCAQMETAEDLDALLEKYQTLLDESESMDADNYEVNIRRQLQLAQLGDKESLSLSALSGGEYKLIQVIRQMLLRPGLLIMDEPDVFLDFENLKGLRELINAYRGTLLVVTHSRYLLEHCFDKLWHLENGDLQEFEGSFREYNYSRLRQKLQIQKDAALGAGEVQRAAEMVERLRKEASEVVDPVKGRALKAKVTYLERWESRRIKPPFVELRQPDIRLPQVERTEEPQVLLEVNNYNLSFEEKLLEEVTFSLRSHEKVAIVGPNGTGKTTLLRAIRNRSHPSISFSPDARVGFFSQLQEETLNEDNSIYQEFYDLGFDTPSSVEEYLRGYCFEPDVLSRKVRNLSGGEKNLLQLAKLAAGNANLLLLDEPSSHLDTFAQIALEDAINAYQGAVLMVSHDFYSIANCAERILYVENGTIRPMSARAFRKMIYKNHFGRDDLELEQRKKDLETRISRCMEAGQWDEAETLCTTLGETISAL